MNPEIEKSLTVCNTIDNAFIILNSTCIAARDRRTGEWLQDHCALGERVSLVPKAKTAYELKAWKLIVFTFSCRIEIGPIIDITSLTAEQKNYVYNFSRYRHVLSSLLNDEVEPPRRVA